MRKLEQINLSYLFEREADKNRSFVAAHKNLQNILEDMEHPCENMFGIYRISETGLEHRWAIYQDIFNA